MIYDQVTAVWYVVEWQVSSLALILTLIDRSATVAPGCQAPWLVTENILITNISLDHTLVEFERSTLRLNYGLPGATNFETVTVATLIPGANVCPTSIRYMMILKRLTLTGRTSPD